MSDEREKAFWAACKVQTYDLEYLGEYGFGADMRKQTHDPSGTNYGDYVRADDFRAEVEALRKRVGELERDIGAINNDWHAETMRKLAAERKLAEAEGRVAELVTDIRDWDAKHKQVFGNWQSAAAKADRAEARAEDLTRKLDQAQRENSTLATDNERFAKQLRRTKGLLRQARPHLLSIGVALTDEHFLVKAIDEVTK